jgi:hypothetical protein
MNHAQRVIQQLSEFRDLPMLRTTYYTHVPHSDGNSPYAQMKSYMNNCRAIIFAHLNERYVTQETDKDLGNTKHHREVGEVEGVNYYSIEDLYNLVESSGIQIKPKFRTSLEDAVLRTKEGTPLVAREVLIDRLSKFNYLEPVTAYCAKSFTITPTRLRKQN